MTKSVLVILALCLFCASVQGLVWPTKHPRIQATVNQQDYPAQWFTQTLDHFSGQDSRTFQQKYYVNDQYWNKNNGPVILYINGEGPVYSPPYTSDDEVVLLAQKYGALIVTLEHRYYGESSPFDTLTTPNLQYLSSKQALYDLAVFITNFTSSFSPASQKIFTIGGSYSGALSAWFRLKYPHITTGSIASSGVVNAILDFTAFDEQVAQSAGPACANALRMVTSQVEAAVTEGGDAGTQVRALFEASTLVDNGDFMYFLADSMAEGIQYGFHDQLCNPLLAAIAKNTSVVSVYANYTINVWGQALGSPAEYATSWQQNVTHDPAKADRQWWYQTCTEFGWFQNAPATGSIRSAKYVNMDYHQAHCNNVFGEPLWPDVEGTNIYYGGNKTAATKVFFANGSQDPWQRASIVNAVSHSEPTGYITCLNCGHCVDLRGCPNGCANPNNLQQMRGEIMVIMGMWLQDQN